MRFALIFLFAVFLLQSVFIQQLVQANQFEFEAMSNENLAKSEHKKMGELNPLQVEALLKKYRYNPKIRDLLKKIKEQEVANTIKQNEDEDESWNEGKFRF